MTIYSCKPKQEIDKSNPFFGEFNTPFNVPPFEKIMAKHYMPAFEKGMADGRKEIEKIVKNRAEPTFANTIEALDRCNDLFITVRDVFYGQAEANTNDSLQAIEMEISPKISEYEDEKKLNPELFKRIKQVYEKRAESNLTPEQLFILENLYKEYVRLGANLSKEDQDSLKKINQKLSVLTVKYDQNVLAETNNYKLYVGKDDLKGLPESLVASAAEVAKAAGQEDKWAFTTQRPSIFPFIQYSPNRELRHEIFNAYINRGNNGNEYDNNKILAEIISLRAERAKLLGYKNHSDIVLEPRMAKEPENVFNLLNNLWEKAIPVAKKEVVEMQKIIDREGGKFKLEPSDWWYYAEKLRKQKYDLDEEELKPYFKLDNVREGAFTLASKLFGMTFSPMNDIPLPHPDAQAFEVKDADGSHLGVLYMDFFPRDSKRQGAWCLTYRIHKLAADQKIITPVVTTVFNFTPPAGNDPVLLTMEEVSTLFHEFGHALDALSNKNSYNQTYVAWDFVELPSQLMEHWVTEPEMLSIYAKHYKTGEPMPKELIDKIKNSSFFNQGFSNVEIYAASLLDMAYHTLEAPVKIDVQTFEKEYFTRLGLIPEIVSRYRSTYFTHITGGYDSGYYSYTWAAVLDNDAFEAFKEKGIFDKGTADSYRKNILQENGIMDPMQMYVNFRGHEPGIEPYLRNLGFL
ncbi:MAG: peptidase M3 [Bacteroidales bacterium]|jgi:peptidyl-dipeptidase Dcp|nr:peptidase M3 [Bacteroidales bacterium]HOU01465.1 M3 family metallopeptidase [Bacteroidales bacterium]HQK68936.1 M3 family metallopeptidase [Bacteroidales bacterium]